MAYWLIDQGNTRSKCSYIESCGYDRDGTHVTNFVIGNADILAGESERYACLLKPADKVFVASVASAEKYDALIAALTVDNIQRVVTQPKAFGVTNVYDDCSRHGVDRWLAILAAYNYNDSAEPVLVIDCGTAITVDVVASNGLHEGGYIVPSESLMSQGLQVSTGDIRLLHERKGVPEMCDEGALQFGLSTDACVYHGVALMAESFLRSVLRWAQTSDYKVFVTGGGSIGYSALWSDFTVRIVPNLVIDGLSLYAKSERV